MASTPEAAAGAYAELHAISNFTFLRGASHPEELVSEAKARGYAALALTDECSLAGIVRAHAAAKTHGFRLIVGAEFRLTDGPRFVALVRSRAGYTALCTLITRGRRQAPKGEYRLTRADVAQIGLAGQVVLWLPGAEPEPADGAWLRSVAEDCVLAVELLAHGDDRA